ncbi:cell agglutination protein Mam3 [Vermiconidia calcicola]|uniref:Cell agglutination protein Mam3 n=1 Tax=Vermiconidia calcicola TaxID=1690605 RepID=A0ACC3N9Y5_9PEZI|nr:cell agglutination protein Mam3 [Vermiconidia calcicola]
MASYTYDSIELGDQNSLGCKCCRFSYGIDLPIPKNLPIDEIKSHAAAFSTSILKDWTTLNAIVKRFEATIQKRWVKKSSKQKRDILLTAWPDMANTHRPDFIGFRSVLKTAPRSRTLPSAAFLWPYINLEDLQQRHLLLIFLNSRGRNLPETFVTGDLRAAHRGEGWKGTDASPIEECFHMAFNGQHTPRTYGWPVPCDSISCTRQTIWHDTQNGLLVLEIQQRIYAFLLACTKLILHDINPGQYLLAPHQPCPPLPQALCSEWPSLSAHMLEMPYRMPEKPDVNRLKYLVSARRAAAEDHIWLLREDPGYFVENLREWREHDQDSFKHQCPSGWRMVARNMISDAFTYFRYWDWIYRRLAALPPVNQQLQRANYNTLHLAKPHEQVWTELTVVVEDMISFSVMQLSNGLRSSPRLRHIYSAAAIKHHQKLTDSERRVDVLFHAIVNEDKRKLHGLQPLVQEVQYMLDTCPEASQLVDSWLLRQYSDLAMLSELLTRIEGFVPWSTGWLANSVLCSKTVRDNTGQLFDMEVKLRLAFDDLFADTNGVGAMLSDSSDGRFDHPATKRLTEATVNTMRFSEAGLDTFWAALEAGVKAKTKYSLINMIERRLFQPRKLYRTPKWTPPLVEEKGTQPLQKLDANLSSVRSKTAIPDVVTPAKTKTKIKTRGIAVPENDIINTSSPNQSASTEQAPSAITIKVPKRAYKVLSALLPTGSADSHQRAEIALEELLQAMNTIGLQPEKLYGSIWIFMPKSKDNCTADEKQKQYWIEVSRSIQFHEPKEVRRGSKIPTNMVRTFGRRLKHAYGWEGGMFVCE